MFAFLSPYKLLIEVIAIGAIILGIAFGIHKFLSYEQQIGYDKAVAEYTAKENEALKAAAEKTAALQKQLDEANQHAQAREQTIKSLAAAAVTASGGLHDTINAISRSVPSASIDALRIAVSTFGTVLNDCQNTYRAMAEIADRHASDARTLTEAWPK
jgi:N-methylhydantoinase A/oxoprolinase/acetone carboxylase beta subunit